jgi:lactate permease
MAGAEVLAATLPIAAILVLMLGLGWSAARAALAGLGVAIVLVLTVFGAPEDLGMPELLLGVVAEAAWTALTILAIIVPALVIHRLSESGGSIDVLRAALVALSSDPRTRLLLIAWFFALLLEGASGFGTAGALAAPFLVGLGVPAVTAVTAALLGHAVGVTYGALGTPIVPQVVASGLPGGELAAAAVPFVVLLAPFVPPLLVLVARDGAADHGLTRIRPGPWLGMALLAALAFIVPMALLGLIVGPELPTMGGALVGGMAFLAVLLRRGRVREARGPTDDGRSSPDARALDRRAVAKAAAPYLALVALVLSSRLLPPLRDALLGVEVGWSLSDGTFSGSVAPLYHPGAMILLALLIGARVQGVSSTVLAGAFRATLAGIGPVALALLAMLMLSRLMLQAGMIDALAAAAAMALGGWWPLVAPAVAALGTFMTGSATASNVLFSDLQVATAEQVGLTTSAVLGVANVGAAVGNAIAPHNLIAAAAVVGLAGHESQVLRRTFPVVLPAIVLLGLAALMSTGR